MRRNENLYFNWIYGKVSDMRYDKYSKLMSKLFSAEFFYILDEDENRYEDGVNLRRRFEIETGESAEDLDFPCSILEMMVALSMKLEEQFMYDNAKGCRIGQWFWEMITNLGLENMTNDQYNDRRVSVILERFLNRKYNKNGKGGLFVIRTKNVDVREYEIWYQACWYLDEVN